MIIGKTQDGKSININLSRLIESRLILQANSGGGKSWAIRRILEQTHGHVQQLVIDVEDEFHTLREKYDYVLAGKGGDCPADLRSAPLLARRLLELNVSAIIGIYELRAHERIRFVRLFLDALVNAPRDLWHPVLVVVDEAHIFAPQQGQAESTGAVIDLMTRGRKRGFCGILATQRISKLHKDAAAEANNKLIGRSALDVDMKRAADELGSSGREDQARLRTLKPGEFFCYGPAISDQVIPIKVEPIETTHPRAGQRAVAPPPPREKVQKVLAQLADLPHEAEQEANTVAELRQKIAELERERRQAPAPAVDRDAIRRAHEQGKEHGRREAFAANKEFATALERDLTKVGGRILKAIDFLVEAKEAIKRGHGENAQPHSFYADTFKIDPNALAKPVPIVRTDEKMKLPKAESSVLRVLSYHPDGWAARRVAVQAGYSHKGGGFNNAVSSLRSRGFIDGGRECLRITQAGLDALGPIEQMPRGADLRELWKRQLGKAERAILEALEVAANHTLDKETLACEAGYEASGGGFNNALAKLRTLELVSGKGDIALSVDLL